MSVEYFLDTNLFIYQLDGSDERKRAIADAIIRQGVETGNAGISFQVVQECLNTLLGKAEIPLDLPAARSYMETVLEPLICISTTIELYHRALDIKGRYGFGFFDALIVAAALEAGCSRLYSEDLQDGQKIEHLVITDPFKG